MKIPTRIAKRKIKLLESELQMLQLYKTDADMLLDEYKKEYARDMLFIENNINKKQSTSEQKEVVSQPVDEFEFKFSLEEERPSQNFYSSVEGSPKEKVEAPAWAKKLFRKIALSSHPDRVSESDARLKKIFIETNAAMDQGDFEKLLGFALELGISDDSSADISMIPLLERRIKELKLEIKEIEELPEWLWGEGLGIIDMRSSLATIYLRDSRGYLIDLEELKEIITRMEKQSAE